MMSKLLQLNNLAGLASAVTLIVAGAGPVQASALTACTFQFDATAEMPHGSLAVGDKLEGEITFKLGRMEEKGDTRYYHATGEIKVARPGHGALTGEVKYVHVTRSVTVADYVSIGAGEVKGSLGGVNLNFDPVLATLYGPRGMLNGFDLPKRASGWNAFKKKRVFQYHSPVAHRAVLYGIGPFRGGCT